MAEHDIEYEGEVPNSPMGRLYFRPKLGSIITCAMGVSYPIDIEAFKHAFANSIMIKHPRFCSLIVKDENGKEEWKRTNVNFDDHFIVHQTTAAEVENEDDKDGVINSFLAQLYESAPLSEDRPLWEVHVLVGLKCVVLRVHHAVGDGVSLMSMLDACFGDNVHVDSTTEYAKTSSKGVWYFVKSICFTMVFLMRIFGRLLWVKDNVSLLSGGHALELSPRKLVTVKFLLEDFLSIKNAIPNATINDVLLGVISLGLSKYINDKSSKGLQQAALQLTSIIVVNLRKNSSLKETSDLMLVSADELCGWGNKTGSVLVPMCCSNKLHPLDHVRVMKKIMDKKKHSYEAYFTYMSVKFAYFISPKVVSWCTYKFLQSTSILISNAKGPSKEIKIAGNPVTFIRVNANVPHALFFQMLTYAEKVNLQIIVAKDVISDPEILVRYIEHSLLEMKTAINEEMV